MKVYDIIELFHRKRGLCGPAVVSDEEFRQGLSEIINAVLPYRKDPEKCVDTYYKIRDALPLTASIADKESLFSRDFAIGQKSVDLAVLEVIYEDRYSFGHLYWALIQKNEDEPVEIDRFVDPEAPFKKDLIGYAVDFDLEDTVAEFWGRNLDDRLIFAKERLGESRQRVLVHHQIKDDYESALTTLIDHCLEDLKAVVVPFAVSGPKQPLGQATDVESGSPDRPVVEVAPEFARRIIKKEHTRELMAFLHEGIDGQTGEKALVYLQAAIDAGLLMKPKYKEVVNEFGEITGYKNYQAFMGSSGLFIQNKGDLASLTKMLNLQFK